VKGNIGHDHRVGAHQGDETQTESPGQAACVRKSAAAPLTEELMHLAGDAGRVDFPEGLAVGTELARNLVDTHGVQSAALAAVFVAVMLADVVATAPLFAVSLGSVVLAEHGAAAVPALVLDAPVRTDAGAAAIATLLLATVVLAVRSAAAFPESTCTPTPDTRAALSAHAP
jgi:hypothetical protein